jgi:hypothetical protein
VDGITLVRHSGVLPGASAAEIEEAYQAKAQLRRAGRAWGFPGRARVRPSDFDFVAGDGGAEVLGILMALFDWRGPHPSLLRRLVVPDVGSGSVDPGQRHARKGRLTSREK